MSVWDRVRQLIRTARRLGPAPRRLISGLSRLGKGAAVTPTRPRAPLVKYSITLTYRDPLKGTGSAEILEVSPPRDLLSDLGEVGRWIRDRFYGGVGFVLVSGIEEVVAEAPTEPRLSLPRALPELRKDPETAAIRELNAIPARARPFYGYIKLDLDGVAPNARAIRRWAKRVGLGRAYEWRPSASGQGTHVRFRIREGVRPKAAFALRVALGDDPVRAAIDESRYAYHGRAAIGGVLFDQKGENRAGTWRRSRK